METAIHNTGGRKPLAIDFDLHTDGDQEFKRELIVLMIDNIRELQESFTKSKDANQPGLFRETSHKVKPTISILNDHELMETIEALKNKGEGDNEETIRLFYALCDNLIKNLQAEMSG